MCRILTLFVKKLFSNPNAACLHATFLIEVFVHVAIENKRLSCLLCISAIIGVAHNRRYTAAVAVLFGGRSYYEITNRNCSPWSN
jgi:hypothetical protein